MLKPPLTFSVPTLVNDTDEARAKAERDFKKIVREHGGAITVTSRRGQGSRFTITLPLRRCDAKGTGGDMATLM